MRFPSSRFLTGKKTFSRPFFSRIFLLIFCVNAIFVASHAAAATYQTKNFTVSAHDPKIAQKMATRAEELRKSLAELWLGKTLPNWFKRADIKIRIGQLSPGGQTTFIFNDGEVYDWNMSIQGTEERIYDSVLPHEITHMILASHFRQPVPRWADEGAATFTESLAERQKYQKMLLRYLKGQQGIPMDRLFGMDEYPQDPLPLYAQGYSVSEFLIRQRGPKYFVYFVECSMQRKCPWSELIYDCYGYETLQELQADWVAWVADGCPEFLGSNLIAGDQKTQEQVVANTQNPQNSEDGVREDAKIVQASAAFSEAGDSGVMPATFQERAGGAAAGNPQPGHEAVHWKSTDIHPE